MNDQDIIATLQLLKRLEPRDEVVSSIKRRVFHKTGISRSGNFNIASSFRFIFTPAFGFACVVLFLGITAYQFATYNPMPKTVAMVYTASSSLESAQSVESLLAQEVNLDAAQKNIEGLDLRGVPGKYTSQECHDIYIQYEQYMTDYRSKILTITNSDNSVSTGLQNILDKISKYEAINEIKWPSLK